MRQKCNCRRPRQSLNSVNAGICCFAGTKHTISPYTFFNPADLLEHNPANTMYFTKWFVIGWLSNDSSCQICQIDEPRQIRFCVGNVLEVIFLTTASLCQNCEKQLFRLHGRAYYVMCTLQSIQSVWIPTKLRYRFSEPPLTYTLFTVHCYHRSWVDSCCQVTAFGSCWTAGAGGSPANETS